MTLNPEELAQKLADYFNPPHFEERRRTDLKPKELRELPWEERLEQVWCQSNPESSTMVVRRGYDGPYITALTYLDITVALQQILEEESSEKPNSSET